MRVSVCVCARVYVSLKDSLSACISFKRTEAIPIKYILQPWKKKALITGAISVLSEYPSKSLAISVGSGK